MPLTWPQLLALSDQIVEDGGVPWCIENNYTGADLTGLPAVVWLQDIMLRTSSLEDYDRWVRGELKSSSSPVRRAVHLMSDVWLKPSYVYGGLQAINSTGIGELVPRMLDDPPKCWLMKEPSNLDSDYLDFPDDRVFGRDYAFFLLPPIERMYGNPALVETHIFGMFNDRPEVRALMEYFTADDTKEYPPVGTWALRSIATGYSSGLNFHVSPDFYRNEAERVAFRAVRNATNLRLGGGSTRMPGEVVRQLQTSLVSYVGGDVDLDTALKQVDAAWPAQTPATELPSERILFFGDSNTWWVDEYFPKLAASSDVPIQVESKGALLPGAPLERHWDMNTAEIDEIRAGKWDVVVLEEDLGDDWPYRATELPEYARKFHEVINEAGADMVLFISYPDTTVTSPTTRDIADVLRRSATELGVEVAPVGLAFQRAIRARPELDLYSRDGDHPSPSGYYLTLAVLYATIFERSPIGLSYRLEDVDPNSDEADLWSMPKGWTLTDHDALFLQQVAWETVQDYEAGQR